MDVEMDGRNLKRWAFYAVTVITLAVAVVLAGELFLLAFVGWVEDLGIHQVHDLNLSSLLILAFLVPIALMLYRPDERVTTIFAPILIFVPLVVFAAIEGSEIVMVPLLFGALSLVVLLLHPAGRDLLQFEQIPRVNRLVGALLVLAAIPLAVYAVDQAITQVTVTDEHTEAVHYGGMATTSLYIIVMGAVAATRKRDWRFAAWTAGILAVVVGAASIGFDTASSAGDMWGILAVLWAVTFVASVEYSRRSEAEETPAPAEAETPGAM